MKHIVALVLVTAFLVPHYSYAQVKTTQQNEAVLQLIASLLKQIEILQAKLEAKKLEEQKLVKTETVSASEYTKKVSPLVDKLDEIQKEISDIEDSQCTKKLVDKDIVPLESNSICKEGRYDLTKVEHPFKVNSHKVARTKLAELFGVPEHRVRRTISDTGTTNTTVFLYEKDVKLLEEKLESLEDLKEEESEIKKEIEKLKDRYGI